MKPLFVVVMKWDSITCKWKANCDKGVVVGPTKLQLAAAGKQRNLGE